MTRRKQKANGKRDALPTYEVLFRVLFCTGMVLRVTYLSVTKYDHLAKAFHTLLVLLH